MLDAGFVNVQKYADDGWLTGLKYADEIESDLEKEADCEEGKLKKVRQILHHGAPLCTLQSRTILSRRAVLIKLYLIRPSFPLLFTESPLLVPRHDVPCATSQNLEASCPIGSICGTRRFH